MAFKPCMKLETKQSPVAHDLKTAGGYSFPARSDESANSSLRRDGFETVLINNRAARSSSMTFSRNRRILMRPPLFSTLIPAVAISGMALILGCGDESRKVAAPTPAASLDTNLAATTSDVIKADPTAVVPDVLPAATSPPKLSPPTEQVVQLARASVGDEVLL